jgi:hypothetical protein
MDRYEKAIKSFCRDLQRRLLKKFKAGRIEHGGQPVNVDCQKEMNLEVLDILNYHLIDKVNGKEKGKTRGRKAPKN